MTYKSGYRTLKNNISADVADGKVSKSFIMKYYDKIPAVYKQRILMISGRNANGQLGINSTTNRSSPTIIPGQNWKQISIGKTGVIHWPFLDIFGNYDAGWFFGGPSTGAAEMLSEFVMAVKEDGTLWGWGHNLEGQLGDGTSINRSSPVQIGSDTDWKQVSCGGRSTLALKNNGTIWQWGQLFWYGAAGGVGAGISSPQLVPNQRSNYIQVSAGRWHMAALDQEGIGYTWGGLNNFGQLGHGGGLMRSQPTQISTGGITGFSGWQKISCGGEYTIGLTREGTLYGWGDNAFGQWSSAASTLSADVPTVSSLQVSARYIDAGNQTSVLITTEGQLYVLGSLAHNLVGDSELYDDFGTAYLSGLGRPQSNYNWGKNWVSASVSKDTLVAVRSDGTAWVAGNNRHGQLGVNSTISTNSIFDSTYYGNTGEPRTQMRYLANNVIKAECGIQTIAIIKDDDIFNET